MATKKYLLIFSLLALIGFGGYWTSQEAPVDSKTALSAKKINSTREAVSLPQFETNMPEAQYLTEWTQKIVGFDSSLSIRDRNKLVWDLRKTKLTKQDFEALFAFLKQNPKESGRQLGWHSLKNDLLVLLIDDGRYKESTAQVMMDIVNDPKQHSVMREYVLQYTTDYFERHWLTVTGKEKISFSEVDKQAQQEIMQTMQKSLAHPQGPIAGTALIRLHELSQKFSFVDQQRIDAETKRMVSDPLTSESSLMAALSIAAERKLYGLEEDINNLLWDSSKSVPLRMAAMSSLAKLNPNEQLIAKLKSEFMDLENSDKRLKKAAQLTLKKIIKIRGQHENI